jgi:valyl-tRNA synthetase
MQGVATVQEEGLYRGKADNKMSLPLCSRSKDVIEPMLKPQWWVNCGGMAAKAADAARSGELQVRPQASVRCCVIASAGHIVALTDSCGGRDAEQQ